MKVEGLSTSVAVLAQEHNPTILHPAFLTAQGVVPKDWEMEGKPFCTPAFSTVNYRNGISFTVENTRFQVSDNKLLLGLERSPVAELASAYLSRLPHVRYTEVSIQFQVFLEHDEPPTFLIGRFLRPGKWNHLPLRLDGLGLRFEYPVEGATLDLYCDSGSVEQEEIERTGVVLSGLYNSDLSGDEPLPQALALLGMWPDRCRHLLSTANAVMGIEE